MKTKSKALVTLAGVACVGLIAIYALDAPSTGDKSTSPAHGNDNVAVNHDTATSMLQHPKNAQYSADLQQKQNRQDLSDGIGMPSAENGDDDASKEVFLLFPSSASAKVAERNLQFAYFTEEDLTSYRGYSREVLEALAQEGDQRAIRVLSYEIPFEEVEKHKELIRLSAVHGGTVAFIQLGAFEYFGESPEEKHRAALAEQAWLKVGIMRGDRMLEQNARIGRINRLNRDTLAEEEQQIVDRMASRWYEDLAKEREALGLPAFDNAIPEDVDLYYDYVTRDRVNDLLSGELDKIPYLYPAGNGSK